MSVVIKKSQIKKGMCHKANTDYKDPYQNLMAAIVGQSLKDVVCPKADLSQKDQKSALLFLNSQKYKAYLDVLGVEITPTEMINKAREQYELSLAESEVTA